MRIIVKHIIIFLVFFTTSAGVNSATANNLGYVLSSFTVMQPRQVKKVQKKQEKKEQNERKEIKKSSKETQKRAYQIQSPEVKMRMKQNKKDIKAREKARKKHNNSQTKKGASKYK